MEPLASSDPVRIASYELLARLGAGGMGLVFLARSPGGRLVAVKIIHSHLTDDPRFRERFRREVEAAKAVSGFYTAPVIDADPDGRPAWLATAHVAGPDLNTVVKAHGPLPEGAFTVLAAALAEALRAVHAAGLVHRDLKPSNILLAQDGPRVIDFGIARAVDGTETTGGLVGTPGYMSPEQAAGEEAGPTSDVFSLGGVLYFASTGRPPFGDGDLRAVLLRVMNAEPDLSVVPVAQRDLIARCLTKSPSARPTPDQILGALAGAVATAGQVDWADAPYGRVIDDYVTEVSQYTAARPKPEVEPEPEVELATEPEVEQRTAKVAPPIAPRASRKGSRRWLWALSLPLVVVTVVVVVLTTGDSPQGSAGFRPWSLGDVYGVPLVSDGLVYVGGSKGTAAHDARTGRQRWRSKSGEAQAPIGRSGVVLLVRGATSMSALDARTGARRWRIPFDGFVCAGGRPDSGGRIIVAEEIDSDRLRLSAIEPARGSRVWSETVRSHSSDCHEAIIEDDRVSLAENSGPGRGGGLVSLATSSGKGWRRSTGFVSEWTVGDTNLYAAISASNGVYRLRAYEVKTGRQLWDIPFPPKDAESTFIREMAGTGSDLYLLDEEGLHAFDGADGHRRWTSPIRMTSLSVGGNTAFVWGDATDYRFFRPDVERTAMAAIDLASGRRLWWKQVDSDAGFTGTDDRTAYVDYSRHRRFRPDDNALLALDLRTGRQRWRRGMDVDRPVVVQSGIIYALDGRTLEAIDAPTGAGP
ncbi:serine/threonine-protein kinase [Spirillospora sp. NBC_00431]